MRHDKLSCGAISNARVSVSYACAYITERWLELRLMAKQSRDIACEGATLSLRCEHLQQPRQVCQVLTCNVETPERGAERAYVHGKIIECGAMGG